MTTTVTLRPSNTGFAGGGWAVTGAASAHAATSDDSDASYVTSPGTVTELVLDFPTPTLEDGSVVVGVTIRVRASQSTGSGRLRARIGSTLGPSDPSYSLRCEPTSSIAEYAGRQVFTDPADGARWAVDDLPTLRVRLQAVNRDSDIRVYEVYLDVEYDQPPTVDVVGPSGAQTTSDLNVELAIDDPDTEGQAIAGYHVKVFDEDTYTAVGFDPDTSTAVWDSDVIVGNTDAVAIGRRLDNGTTYRAYALVAGSSAIGVDQWAAAWDYSEFTVELDEAARPTVALSFDSALNAVRVTVTGHDNLLDENRSSFEAGATTMYDVVGNAAWALSTDQAAHGAQSAKLTKTTSTGTMGLTSPSGGSLFGVVEGLDYDARASFRANTTGRSCTVEISFLDFGGAVLDTVVSDAVVDSNAGWAEAVVQGAVAPAGAVGALVTVRIAAVPSGEVHYVDQLYAGQSFSQAWSIGGLTTGSRFLIERSDDAGATWAPIRGGNEVAAFADLLEQAVEVIDYEAPVGQEPRYRAWTYATIDGQEVSSTTPTLTMSIDVPTPSSWWLKAPHDSDLNATVRVTASSGRARQETTAVFRPLGRPDAVVVADDLNGAELPEDGTLQIIARGDAEWATVRALLDYQGTLLLQSPYGDHRYIRVVDERPVAVQGPAGDPRRTIEASYVQVAQPAIEITSA